MKKWGIVVGAFSLLIFLGIRGIYKTVHRIDDEKLAYVRQLHLACTLQIDSVFTFPKGGGGLAFCTLISGNIDNSIEFQLNKKLAHHKRIRFLTRAPRGRYLLLARRVKCQVNDSLQVNSDKDQVIFYRAGEITQRAKVSNFLREVVF